MKEQEEVAQRIGSIFQAQKKLLRKVAKLAPVEDPILFLQRTSGELEIYHKVKGNEFNVPGLPDGIEKKILLGKQWQVEIPYAGRTIRSYWGHEDYAFPHVWTKINTYHGSLPELIKNKVDGIPIILESANVNSEALRDRERKTLLAWEKMLAKASAANWQAWAKTALYVGGAIALIIFAVNYFKKGDGQTGIQTLQLANQTIQNGVKIG